MTTITNFIEGNFISNPEHNSSQRPIWILDSNSALNPKDLIESLLWKCGQDKKPLIILDIGLATLKKISKASETVTTESGMNYVRLEHLRPVYLVKTDIKDRIKPAFLLDTLKKVDMDIRNSQTLKKDREPALEGWGILVQGLQTFTVLTKNQKHSQIDIESFVSSLSSISPLFRQIVILSNSKKLSLQVNFALERISTCLTRLTNYKEKQWQCKSTVRRYTGYFKEQQYTIVLKDNRVKVSKLKSEKEPEKSELQAELFGGLGFKAEKNQQTQKMSQELKQMIFPHLKMQNKCEEKECETKCICKEEVPQNLIVLDEEQEDDEDLDV